MLYISLGSNLGNRINNLKTAVDLISTRYLRNSVTSIILETESILPENAPASWNKPFLNMIIAGETDLSPQGLLKALKSIESEMGRSKPYERWSPRIIDLDILIWDDLEVDFSGLTIPHKELINRPFLQHLLALMGVKPWQYHKKDISFKKSFVVYPQFVGVVNVTSDSFSDGGNFNQTDKAINQVLKLASDGASVVEIGAQSTRPGAVINNSADEYNKLKPILDGLLEHINQKILTISIDTFWPSVIYKLLEEYPVDIVNDVKGRLDEDTLKFIAEKNCKICLMHSLSIPPTKEIIIPFERKAIETIKDWGKLSVDRLLKLGFLRDQIILDPGIGFGKSVYQNIEILREIRQLRILGVKIMVGHSRKSYISAFSQIDAANRDIETIAISAMLGEKVDFLRVHNVADHMRFLATYKNFNLEK